MRQAESWSDPKNIAVQDRHSLVLLLSILLFIVLAPFLAEDLFGKLLLLVSIFVVLVTATLELSDKRALLRPALILAGCSILTAGAALFYPWHWLVLAAWTVLTVFFGFASVGLYTYLGQPGSVTRGRIYASASLYLILGILWWAVFNLINTVYPGAFIEAGPAPSTVVPRSALLYFSFATLTTLGYGDIVPVHPVARIFASLEAVTGVLYIAITVARLVAAYQRPARANS